MGTCGLWDLTLFMFALISGLFRVGLGAVLWCLGFGLSALDVGCVIVACFLILLIWVAVGFRRVEELGVSLSACRCAGVVIFGV